MSHDFPAFALSEEHEAFRKSVRALADDQRRGVEVLHGDGGH
jgi:hypothetical protein